MGTAAAVFTEKVGPHDVALRVDPKRLRPAPKSRRYINGVIGALAQKETHKILVLVVLSVESYNVAARVDPNHISTPRNRSRYFDACESTLAQHKTHTIGEMGICWKCSSPRCRRAG
jgi:hypothetical protein